MVLVVTIKVPEYGASRALHPEVSKEICRVVEVFSLGTPRSQWAEVHTGALGSVVASLIN